MGVCDVTIAMCWKLAGCMSARVFQTRLHCSHKRLRQNRDHPLPYPCHPLPTPVTIRRSQPPPLFDAANLAMMVALPHWWPSYPCLQWWLPSTQDGHHPPRRLTPDMASPTRLPPTQPCQQWGRTVIWCGRHCH